MKYKYCKNTQ